MEKFTQKTNDGTSLNIEALKKLFPEVVSEGKVDFEALKTILGGEVAGDERYQFTWAGKRAAMLEASTPITKTLRPCVSESKDWESTKNIFIEGDNLDALKILQNTYGGKVKMIYIDPPYNTGHDFIYHDNFHGTKAAEAVKEGAVDAETGERFKQNTESNGYFHSDWCSMMYPRLKLARNLLRDDGVIFVTLDENEIANGRKLMDQIFQERNFLTQFVWEKKKKPSFLKKSVGVLTDYILCYAKNESNVCSFSIETTTAGKKYPLNNAGNGIKILTFPAGAVEFSMEDCTVTAQDMSEGNIVTRLLNDVQIVNGQNLNEFKLEGEWRYSQEKVDEIIANGEQIVISKVPFRPNHVKEGGEVKKMANMLTPSHYSMETNEDGTSQCIELMGCSCFSNPKPEKLLRCLIKACTYNDPESIVMDFFAGSGTHAHSTMMHNAMEAASLRYICVQLQEDLNNALSTADDAVKPIVANACNLCDDLGVPRLLTEVTKERIRRAGEKIKAEHPLTTQNLDVGFRVFKVDSSNMENVFFKPADYKQANLIEAINNVKTGRTGLDLLFGCLLEWGLPIDLPTKQRPDLGTDVYDVDDARILACFDMNVSEAVVRSIAAEQPAFAIFRDLSFTSSADKINIGEIFKALSPNTKVKVL